MNPKKQGINPAHLRTPGHSAEVSAAQMAARIARFRELEADPFAFPDLRQQEGRRSVNYVISPGALGGPAPLTQPHNFHVSISCLGQGVRPTVHSHPYNEVFMPLDARFRVLWGERLAESTVLEAFDMISVPPGVFRTFENLDDRDGHMMAIFDHGGDPHTGIVVPPDVYESFYRGWVPGQGRPAR
jgi:quercetin dioxygenase-like cupin family protein